MAKRRENFFEALVYEKDGDLNLTWLFVLLMGLVGCVGFLHAVFTAATVIEKVAAWSFLGGSFSLVVLAAIPIAKAKILANSKVPGEMAKSIASVTEGLQDPGMSSDIQETYIKKQTSRGRDDDKG